MDRIVFIGIDGIGASIVEHVAAFMTSNKIRINSGRICCVNILHASTTISEESALSFTLKAEDIAIALDSMDSVSEGNVKAIFVGSLSETSTPESEIAVRTLKAYFSDRNRDLEIKGIFILPDAIGDDQETIAESATSEFVRNQGDAVFTQVYFVTGKTRAGRVYPTVGSCVESVSRMLYLAFISGISQEFEALEQNEIKANKSATVYGMLGLSKGEYPADKISRYCGLRASQDIIDQLWIAIDREIDAISGSIGMPSSVFRKKYIEIFESKMMSVPDKDNFFSGFYKHVYNETVTLKDDYTEDSLYSHKVDDFVSIVESMIRIFSSEVDICGIPSYRNGDGKTLADDLSLLAGTLSAKLIKNTFPSSEDRINLKNDASVFGVIANESGSIPEQRVYSHPVAIRYLLYKLWDRLNDIYYDTDIDASSNDLISSVCKTDDSVDIARKYLIDAVRLTFISKFTDLLEKMIRLFEDFFFSLPRVRDNFGKHIDGLYKDERSQTPAVISVGANVELHDRLYQGASIPVDGQTPVSPGVLSMIMDIYFYNSDPLNNRDAISTKNDPVYSLEYNMPPSYKKYFARNKDISVSTDIFHACGMEVPGYGDMSDVEKEASCQKRFSQLVSDLSLASRPLGCSSASILWPIGKSLADNCPELGTILGIDVSKYTFRGFDKTSLECFTVGYGIEL